MRNANLNNYVNLLNDVYAQGYISAALCRQHTVSSRTTRAFRELKYCNMQGKSLINMQPSIKDAKKVIAKNREIFKNYNTKKLQTKIEFIKPKATIKKATISKVKSRPIMLIPPPPIDIISRTEINLFWGMIKIKR